MGDRRTGDVDVGERDALTHVDRRFVAQQLLHCARQQGGVTVQLV
ncbi:hypothetical protein [Streptomyces mirabilis]